jgi:hypothetical protein
MALIDVYKAAARVDTRIRNRVIGACVIAAGTIRAEPGGTANHANRLLWAALVEADPIGTGSVLFGYVLRVAAVIDAIANGTAVTDAQIQTVVDTNVDNLATG